jgi:hypothetical protein
MERDQIYTTNTQIHGRSLSCLGTGSSIKSGKVQLAYPSGAPNFTPWFGGIHVTRYLVLCVCFVDRCLSFCLFSFGHCVVCPSICRIWLPLGIFKLFVLSPPFTLSVFKRWIVKVQPIFFYTDISCLGGVFAKNTSRETTNFPSRMPREI